MIWTLRIIFSLILLTMIVVTGTASVHENILQIPSQVTGDVWFVGTMFDAYFGFLTFYLWVYYRSPCPVHRVFWFVLIMLLGNMAMAGYILLLLFKLPTNATVAQILLRPDKDSAAC